MDESGTRAASRLDAAIDAHRRGDLDAAAEGYAALLADDPANFDALNLLGVILLNSGKADDAIGLLERAVDIRPEAVPALHQLGLARIATREWDEAVRVLERAIMFAPDYVPAHESLAYLLYGQGRLAAAADAFAAVAHLQPQSAAAHNNLGTTLGQLGRHREAFAAYEHALLVEPRHPFALLNYAQLLVKVGRPADAIEPYRVLLAQSPAHADAYYHAGCLFYMQGLRDEAQSAFADAIARDPEHVSAHWAQAMATLPLAYGPGEDPAVFRRHFADAIANLDGWFDASRSALGSKAVGRQQPFYLAFHEVDNVPLLSRYGDLCARLMQAGLPDAAIPVNRPANRTGRVKVAIVSGFFYDQSVWTALLRGWCAHLDRSRFELHLLYTGLVVDAETAIARSHATTWHHGLSGVAQWLDAIRGIAPDVLLYPEIGMDSMSTQLASLRLAPTQVAAWGHPETTGLPTIDYYLSAASFEPPGAGAHYREQLIALPNLGCCYDPLLPAFVEPLWDSLGVDDGVPRLVCAGSPYKYFPEHDHMFVDIARRFGRCQFLFFTDIATHLSRQLEARLTIAFREGGLDAARHVRFLPRQSRPAFFGLMQRCDVYLDTVGFSGFNTAMQAVECGLPVVTIEGRFMRGRLAAGILRRMEIPELVAGNADQYIETVVRLCQDGAYRRDVVGRIVAQRPVLFRDLAPVQALEAFLVRAKQNAPLW